MTDSISKGQRPAAARFKLGSLVATPGALLALQTRGIEPLTLVLRHVSGDFGDLDVEDQHANEVAIAQGLRVLSAYSLGTDPSTAVRIYVITEWDRSVTTILLPEEY